MTRTPDPQDPVDAHACARSAVDRYFTLTFRTLANLTEVAEKVEVAVGLPALPEPEEDKEGDAEDEKIERASEQKESRRYWIGYGVRAAAGVALVWALIGFSLSPPNLPTMPWDSGGGGGGRSRPRPAAFYARTPMTRYTTYAPMPRNSPFGGNNGFQSFGAGGQSRTVWPQQQPGFNGGTPQQPGYSPPRYVPHSGTGFKNNPGVPTPVSPGSGYNPRPYNPPRYNPRGGGYNGPPPPGGDNPGGGGGGGYAPPGGAGGGGGAGRRGR
jgi:hypothetical protein